MFKVLVLQASHSLSDERTEYLIRDRLSFMRFLGLWLADTVPDANTIWTFREALTRAGCGQRRWFGTLRRGARGSRLSGDGRPDHRRHDRRRAEAAQHRRREARSRKAASRRSGRRSRPSCARRTATHAGRSNTPRPSRPRTVPLVSISRSRPSVTRTMSASIADIA